MNAAAEDLLLAAVRAMIRAEVAEAVTALQAAPQRAEGYVGSREAARRAGVQQSTVLAWIGDGRLPATKPPGARGYRVRASDLERFLAGAVRTGEPPADPTDLAAERGRRLAESLRPKVEESAR